MARSLPFEVDLWKVQNGYFEMMWAAPDGLRREVLKSNTDARAWLDHFASLGERLGVRVAEMKDNLIRMAPNVAAVAEEVAALRRVPLATYRLQLNRDFTFRDAHALVSYLHDLGISDLYTSPFLKARSDSSHGYDVCDHSQLNPALGTEEDFEALTTELRDRGMGLILDMVPNHMGIGDESNSWWMDVLENGPSSVYARYFDVDWHPVRPELHNKVLLPILEDQYGKVLESGKFRLSYEDGAFFIHYYQNKLPVAPRSYSSILGCQLDTLVQALGEENEHVRELRSILTAISYLPERTELAPEKIEERNREKEVIKRRIAALYQASAYVRAAIDTAVQTLNGRPGDPRSFDMLDELLDDQAYRPAFWRVAAEEINYRRFFDINDLAAIRMELPDVFQDTHQAVLGWLAEGKITGLRIDHIDGLWNPRSYLRQLQESYLLRRVLARLGPEYSSSELEQAVSAWLSERSERAGGQVPPWPLYVLVEKILSRDESLPEDWAVDGTTGYDFLAAANGVFVDVASQKAFDRIYSRFAGSVVDFRNLTNATKKMIMLVSLSSEVYALAHQLERIAEKNRLYRDFTLNSLTFALREIIAALPVYRTYITGPEDITRQDQMHIEAAAEEAKKRNPRTAATLFDFVRDTLLLRNIQDFREEDRKALVDLVMKFQQVTGPVMAKGVEDTAFYVYNRLTSLNEVGGEPEQFGITVAEFHRRNAERLQRWPNSLLASSSHDTKRSEDVRARIDVLSEIPEEWEGALLRWSRLNAPKKTSLNGELAPDRNDEYLLYQTLLGSWPEGPMSPEGFAAYRDRIVGYMQKATKEAKVHTSWVNPNEQYDMAVRDFVCRLLDVSQDDPFIGDLQALQRRVAYFGRFNSLSQQLLKLTSPGVPDIYQGTEVWDYSLVDPDNRRPVDYQRRRTLLAELKDQVTRAGEDRSALARELLDACQDGRIKLYVTYRTLDFRRAHPELFSAGSYLPLSARGEKREHICTFARSLEEETALVIVPRLVVRLTEGIERPPLGEEVWKDTWLTLPHGARGGAHTLPRYRNLFTGQVLVAGRRDRTLGVSLAEVFRDFPVALLERVPS